jgi:NADP-dependent 3-hydroxy acid dehydrogenase YdfG
LDVGIQSGARRHRRLHRQTLLCAAAAAQQCDEIAIPPSAIASAIGYAIEQPVGIDISEIVVRPTVQA